MARRTSAMCLLLLASGALGAMEPLLRGRGLLVDEEQVGNGAAAAVTETR